jgi:hypothetical protein
MTAKKQNSDYRDIVKRLDVLLNVILSLPTSDGKQLPMLKRVELLSSARTNDDQPLLRNVEIAQILGVSPPFVGVMMNRLRKRTKKKR